MLDLMGGVRQTEREQILRTTAYLAGFAAAGTLPVWAIGAIVMLARKAGPAGGWHAEPPGGRAGRSALVLAVLSLAVWPFVLPHTQAEQRLRRRVEQDVRGGRVDAALETMSAHTPQDFPPHWDPPPRPAYGDDGPPLLGVVEALAARIESGRPTPEWVRRVYLEKFERTYLNGTYLRYRSPSDTQTPDRIERLLNRLPEGPALAEKYQEELDEARRPPDAATSPDGAASQPTTTGAATSPSLDTAR